MKDLLKIVVLAVMALACYCRPALSQTVDFDALGGDIRTLVNDLKDTERPVHGHGIPQPGHPQPGHPQPGNPGHNQPGFPQGPGHNQPGHSGYPQPGNPGHNQPGFPQGPGHNQPGHSGYSQPGNPGHNQPGFPQGPGHNQPGHSGYPQPGHPGHPPIYYPSIPDADDNCVTWKFTAQTPNTRTEKVTGSKKDCHLGADLQYYCSDSSEYFSRRITVNIGERKLEAWEEESLKVCLDSPSSPTLRLGGMLYEYAVASRNSSGFLGANAATVFTLTPGAKKPSAPDSQEISVGSVVAADGGVYMTLNDARADHFKGEKISIKAEGMKLDIDHTLPVDQMISSFVNFKVSGSFEVGSSYILKLMDTPKPGKYAVTVTFSRNGPLSNGASAEVMETFDLK